MGPGHKWILGLLLLKRGEQLQAQTQQTLNFPGHSPTGQTGNTRKAKVAALRGRADIFSFLLASLVLTRN